MNEERSGRALPKDCATAVIPHVDARPRLPAAILRRKRWELRSTHNEDVVRGYCAHLYNHGGVMRDVLRRTVSHVP